VASREDIAMSLALDAPAPVGFGEKIWRINWGSRWC
jgi:hypothetical protein